MKVGIVGMGYVGLPLAVAFCEADTSGGRGHGRPKIAALQRRREPRGGRVRRAPGAIGDGLLATARYAELPAATR